MSQAPKTPTKLATRTRATLTPEQKAAKQAERNATFKKLAAKRLANAIKQIGLIGNLASYKPSDAQRDFVFKQLSEAAQAAHARFQATHKAETPQITIPD